MADEIMEQTAGTPVARDIGVITAEILLYKRQAGSSILEIGRRLNEAKAQLSHGEWLPWLEHQVEFSEASAQRFMRLAREYPNPSPVTDLGVAKALQLLALPAEEREVFMTETHEVNGEEKTVLEMSKRELAKAIRERDEARNQAEGYRLKLESAAKRAESEAQEAKIRVDELLFRLKELQDRPREVAVETVVDQVAIDKAVAAAQAELQQKLEKARKAKEKAEAAAAETEKKLAAAKSAESDAHTAAEKERKNLAGQVEALKKQLTVASSAEVAVFKLHFEQCQSSVNKMTECVEKLAQAGDSEGAGKLKKALAALLTRTLEVLG